MKYFLVKLLINYNYLTNKYVLNLIFQKCKNTIVRTTWKTWVVLVVIMEWVFIHNRHLMFLLLWIPVALVFKTKQHQNVRMIRWSMYLNVRTINALYKIYGNINNTICLLRIRKTKNLTNNLFFTMDVPNVLAILLSIAHKDVFSKIGLNCINLNVQDNNRKLVIQFCFPKYKGLKQPHLLLKSLMMEVCLLQNNKKSNKYLQPWVKRILILMRVKVLILEKVLMVKFSWQNIEPVVCK